MGKVIPFQRKPKPAEQATDPQLERIVRSLKAINRLMDELKQRPK